MTDKQVDEAEKIKSLKEIERLEIIDPPRKINKPKVNFLLSLGIGLILFTCICLEALSSNYLTEPFYTPPNLSTNNNLVVNTSLPVARDTPNPPQLSIDSLSMQLAQDSKSSITFKINYDTVTGNDFCTGQYEITDMAQLRKIYETRFTLEGNNTGDKLRIALVSSDGPDDYVIGDETPLADGDVGKTYFNLVTEPQFRQVANRFTDGRNDWVELKTFYSSGFSTRLKQEGDYFGTETDLTGYSLKQIQRDLKNLSIQPNHYSYRVIWSFWVSKESDENHWLHVTPITGTLGANESQTIQVDFSTYALKSGQYETELLVDYGENCFAPIILPVTLTVLEN